MTHARNRLMFVFVDSEYYLLRVLDFDVFLFLLKCFLRPNEPKHPVRQASTLHGKRGGDAVSRPIEVWPPRANGH